VDGQWHPVLARGVPVRNDQGEVTCWAGINLDISRLKRAEDSRRESEARLREADRRKNDFLAMLSHELRNPLMPIRNSLYILDRVAPGGEEARRARIVIDRQVRHLSRLVDDLLDVVRITSGKINVQPERLDLGDVVRRAAEDHCAIFAGNGVELEVAIAASEFRLLADPARLAQVIGNLLQNAAKFTPRGGRVTLTLERDGGLAVLRVRDTGVGIAPEMLGRVFEPFTQADISLDRSRGGLGLGLALVKTLVTLHGGTVEGASGGLGCGATFTVRLPLEAMAAAKEAPGSVAPHARRRVLVIDDNADAADSMCELLELSGHEVAVAYGGPEGIERARDFKPEIVLSDIGLLGMDGFAVARALRRDEASRKVFLAALSGYALPEDIRKATEAGFDRHLAKPASVEALAAVLEECGRQ